MKRLGAVVSLGLVLAGCAYAAPRHAGVTTPEGGPVPPGHMPPPGACRIWYPDHPPGQQPPPGDCNVLRYQVPPGAILVRG